MQKSKNKWDCERYHKRTAEWWTCDGCKFRSFETDTVCCREELGQLMQINFIRNIRGSRSSWTTVLSCPRRTTATNRGGRQTAVETVQKSKNKWDCERYHKRMAEQWTYDVCFRSFETATVCCWEELGHSMQFNFIRNIWGSRGSWTTVLSCAHCATATNRGGRQTVGLAKCSIQNKNYITSQKLVLTVGPFLA